MNQRLLLLLAVAAALPAAVYEIGPGESLTTIGDVPWATLGPGDEVRIHHRATPYREKWVINRSGTEMAPIVVRGIPDDDGNLPIIDGEDAVTVPGVNFWSEVRGVIKIGGANTPSQGAAWVVVENLLVRNGDQAFTFTDDGGVTQTYGKNAASFFVESGAHITIRGCEITGSGNGLFVAHATSDVVVEGCHVHGNGVVGSIYEHNSYTEANGITFRSNRYGPLRSGAPGNNLKDRSAGTVIVGNWIDDGNRALDLVESEVLDTAPGYHDTWVVGNVLIKRSGGNGQVVHYGGDNGDTTHYRKGTLHFHHNTVYSLRTGGNTVVLGLQTDDEGCDARNNIVHHATAGTTLAVSSGPGDIALRNNWFTTGCRDSFDTITGSVTVVEAGATGSDPGFADAAGLDFGLAPSSPNRDAGTVVPGLDLSRQYRPHQTSERRVDAGAPDRGAFAYRADSSRRLDVRVDPGPGVICLALAPTGVVAVDDDAGGWTVDELWSDEVCRLGFVVGVAD